MRYVVSIFALLALTAGIAAAALLLAQSDDNEARAGGEPDNDPSGGPVEVTLPSKPMATHGTTNLRVIGEQRILVYSPDGKYLVTAALRPPIQVWDAVSGDLVKELSPDSVGIFGFTKDGQQLACIGNGKVYRWNLLDWRGTVNELADEKALIHHLNNHGKRHAYVDRRITPSPAFVVETATGREVLKVVTKQPIARIAYSDSANLLAVISNEAEWRNQQLQIWNVANGKRIFEIDDIAKQQPEGKSGIQIMASSMRFTSDGKTLIATQGNLGLIHRWSTETGKSLPIIKRNAGCRVLCTSPDGKLLVCVDYDGTINMFDVQSGNKIRELATAVRSHSTNRFFGGISLGAYSPDGGRIAVAGSRSLIHVFDSKNGDEISKHEGLAGAVIRLSVSANGKTIAAVDTARNIVAVNSGMLTDRLRIEATDSNLIGFTPVGNLVLAQQDAVKFWDVKERRLVREVRLAKPGLDPIALLSDGNVLATSWRDTLRLWDLKDGKPLAEFPLSAKARSLAATPDGRYLGVATEDRNLSDYFEVWDVQAGRRVTASAPARRFECRSLVASRAEPVFAVRNGNSIVAWEFPDRGKSLSFSANDTLTAFQLSPDGTLVALQLGHPRRRIELWEFHSGTRICKVADAHVVLRFAILPDNSAVVTGHMDGTIRTWALKPNNLAVRAGAKANAQIFDRLWKDLKSAEATRSYLASWSLVEAGDAGAKYLAERLQRREPVGGEVDLQAIRAVRVLRQIGGATAQAALEKISAVDPQAHHARLAKSAVAYLKRQPTGNLALDKDPIGEEGVSLRDPFDFEKFHASYKVDFATQGQPIQATIGRIGKRLSLEFVNAAALKNQLAKPMTADLKDRTLLEALELACGEAELHPVYPEIKYHRSREPVQRRSPVPVRLAKGKRELPIAFAGPFLAEVLGVDEFPPEGTGAVRFALRGYGLSPKLIEAIMPMRPYVFKTESIVGEGGVDAIDEYVGGGASWSAVAGETSYEQVRVVPIENLARQVTSLQHSDLYFVTSVPKQVYAAQFSPADVGVIRRAGAAIVMLNSLTPIDNGKGGFRLKFHRRGSTSLRHRFEIYDRAGQPLVPTGRTGGSSSTGGWYSMDVPQRPAKIIVEVAEQTHLKFSFRLGQLPLKSFAKQPEKLVVPDFGDHEAPVTLTAGKTVGGGRSNHTPVTIQNHTNMGVRHVAARIDHERGGDEFFPFISTRASWDIQTGRRHVLAQPMQSTSLRESIYAERGTPKINKIIVHEVEFSNGAVWKRKP